MGDEAGLGAPGAVAEPETENGKTRLPDESGDPVVEDAHVGVAALALSLVCIPPDDEGDDGEVADGRRSPGGGRTSRRPPCRRRPPEIPGWRPPRPPGGGRRRTSAGRFPGHGAAGPNALVQRFLDGSGSREMDAGSAVMRPGSVSRIRRKTRSRTARTSLDAVLQPLEFVVDEKVLVGQGEPVPEVPDADVARPDYHVVAGAVFPARTEAKCEGGDARSSK